MAALPFENEFRGSVGILQDISQEKQQEQRYRALAEEYETLSANVEDSISFVNVESAESGHVFRIERLNRAYEEETGIKSAAVQGQTLTEVFGEDRGEQICQHYCRCVTARDPISVRVELPVRADARVWQAVLTPVTENGEVTQIIGISRNVTEQADQERRLRTQNEQLEELTSTLSHDLQTPLTAARGRAELLAADRDSEHLTRLLSSLDRAEQIISDSLRLAEQGQVVSEPEPVALAELLDRCWNNVQTGEATIAIEDELTLVGDRSRLQNVFENLLKNAVEHGGESVTVRIGQFGDRGIYVEDTGAGIAEEARGSVFDPGYSSASDGTGLGLAIVKRIVVAHGWQIAVGDGSTDGARVELTNVELAIDHPTAEPELSGE